MRIIIGGDISPSGTLKESIDRGEFEKIAKEIKPLFENADFSIVNFETTIASDNDRPIDKIGPNLKTTPRVIELLKWLGVNVVTMANNHVGDYGSSALERTCEELTINNIQYVGVGADKKDAAKPLYLSKDGRTLAVINCCEHEYGAAIENKYGSNLLDPIRQFYEISEAKKQADYVIVIVHGGHESFPLPSTRMQDTYRFFIDCGADAVINGHQHCVSGIEVYNGKPIYYGIGNLLFNPRNSYVPSGWTEGMLVELNLEDNYIQHKYFPYDQCRNSLSVDIIKNRAAFDEQIKKLSEIITSRQKLEKAVADYYNKSQNSLERRIQPYNGRIMLGLYSRGFLPKIIRKRTLRKLHNLVLCESHTDKLRYFLCHIFKE